MKYQKKYKKEIKKLNIKIKMIIYGVGGCSELVGGFNYTAFLE